MAPSVLVVEDDPSARLYFADALRGESNDYTVTTASTLAEALTELERQAPEVLLVDLGLPDGSGLELIRAARRLSQEILPLVITVFGDEASVVAALEAGAQGYLLKSEAPADLRDSVGQVLAGGAPISPGIASHLLRRFQLASDEAVDVRAALHLTGREREVLELMVQGVAYQEAADTLGITRNTVVSYVKKIYRKLEVTSRGEAVFEALSQGLVRIDPKD
jgi:DNA-binding NarL/FixJ family response regulator